MKALLLATAIVILSVRGAVALDTSRYPGRVPEWLWQDPIRGPLISEVERRAIEADLKLLEAAEALQKGSDAKAKHIAIARRLGSALSVHDLTQDALRIKDTASGRGLAVQLDPSFSNDMRPILSSAVMLFLKHGLDDDVIDLALAHSAAEPDAVPLQYARSDGSPGPNSPMPNVVAPKLDPAHGSITKPRDRSSFRKHLSEAISDAEATPRLLVISRYSGNEWWGGAYQSFYHDPVQRLTARLPAQGYLYVRLNADRMVAGSPRRADPAFWASKIAHEILHNLGYSHPDYKDPAERDRLNMGNRRSFIVAYEQFLLAVAER
jgi:hypothetical protein